MPENIKPDLPKTIMSLIKKGQVKIKPKWYFILGSFAITGGLLGLIILSIFLVSLIIFSLRTHGPMGAMRYEQLFSNFPWWALIIAVVGISLSTWLFKKQDFSYKKNFTLIIFSLIAAIMLTGWLVDYLELDNLWMKRGPMQGLYQQYNGGHLRKSPPWRIMPGRNNKNQILLPTHKQKLGS